MEKVRQFLDSVGGGVILTFRALFFLVQLPRNWRRLVEHCYLIGYTTFPIVAILSFFIGSVLALQTGHALRGLGAEILIGAIVGPSLARELAPVMVSILVAGRVGSAITAELASMKVYNEVDALITMDIPPERMLVMPRLMAILLMMPVLTISANIIGWIGGAIISQYVGVVGVSTTVYFQALTDAVTFQDVMDGLIKAEIFGFLIIVIACNIGLRTAGGPREIGASVTRAVVASLIMILVLDYFITRALM
jgi:phospholipid/cholesterol/gamma-HCH transport system permease protein